MSYSMLIVGPMWSGKTTKLLHALDYALLNDKKCLVILHDKDNRYSISNELHSHKKQYNDSSLIVRPNENVDIVKVPLLANIPQEDLDKHDAIFIDEGHFFSDICNFYSKNYQAKEIYISALNCNHMNQPFSEIAKLSVWVDKLKRLNGSCKKCKAPSRITYKFSGQKSKIIDCGAEDKYISLCMKCYFRITGTHLHNE